jgi:hypothetical protein
MLGALWRSHRGKVLIAALAAGGLLAVSACRADIFGFNNGVGWTGNNNGTGGPTFNGNSLTLTDNGFSEARSAWYNTPQAINTNFTATYTYRAGGDLAADGIAFVLQRSPSGVHALGGAGGGLGYGGLAPSAALEFNIFGPNGVGSALRTNGVTGPPYMNTSPVNLASGDRIQTTVTYNAAAHTVTEGLVDLNTHATFSTTATGVNLPSILGGNTAFVGFTGGTGGGTSIQTVSDFTFLGPAAPSGVPEPASLALMGSGLLGLLAYRRLRRKQAA